MPPLVLLDELELLLELVDELEELLDEFEDEVLLDEELELDELELDELEELPLSLQLAACGFAPVTVM